MDARQGLEWANQPTVDIVAATSGSPLSHVRIASSPAQMTLAIHSLHLYRTENASRTVSDLYELVKSYVHRGPNASLQYGPILRPFGSRCASSGHFAATGHLSTASNSRRSDLATFPSNPFETTGQSSVNAVRRNLLSPQHN